MSNHDQKVDKLLGNVPHSKPIRLPEVALPIPFSIPEAPQDGSTYGRKNAAWVSIVSGVSSVSGTANRITASPTTGAVVVDISASYVGQSSITTLGTISTGTWQGTSISTTYTDAKVVSVSGTTNRITSSGGGTPAIDISASYVGQSSITTLGTITTGVWNGTAIANANLANSTISGVALGGTLFGLSATNATLTFSGTFTGAAAQTVGLNLGNANTWTGQQTFNTSAAIFGVGMISPKWYPASDSTTALQILKADGTTNIVTIDTTNLRVGIGTTAPAASLEVNKLGSAPSSALYSSDNFIITGATNSANGVNLIAAGNAAGHRAVFKGVRTRGTAAVPTTVAVADQTFSLLGVGYDGTSVIASAGINMLVDGAVSTGFMPQAITFETGSSGTRVEQWRIDSGGRLTNTGTTGTAYLHLKSGTATAGTAPLKFNSGTLLTSAEAGAMEFLTDKFYGTITTGAARKEFTLNDAALTSGKIPVATTNGRLTDSAYTLATISKVVSSTFEKAETGSDANILTYAAGASDEFLVVQIATDVSAITGTSIVVTVTWKDSNNVTATSTLTLTAVGDGTVNIPINVHTATNVVVSSVFVGVSTAYNISAFITKLN